MMKKTCFLFVVIAGLALGRVHAQSYKSLWKTTEGYMAKDLPQSALRSTRHILLKAQSEGNEGQMLQALLCRLQLQGEVSPDSAAAERRRLAALLAAPASPALQALVHTALGGLYLSDFGGTNAAADSCLAHLRAALSQPQALRAARVAGYKPALVEGRDGLVADHDLLMPVARQVFGLLHRLAGDEAVGDSARALLTRTQRAVIGLYRRQGKCDAVIVLTLDSLERAPRPQLTAANYQDNAQFRLLQAMARQYSACRLAPKLYERLCSLTQVEGLKTVCLDLARQGIARYPDNAITNSLRRTVNELTCPMLIAEWPNTFVYPGSRMQLNLTVRNLPEAHVNVYRTDLTASAPEVRNGIVSTKLAARYAKQPVATLSRTFVPGHPTASVADSVSLALQQGGIYLLSVSAPGVKAQHAWLSVSSNYMSSLQQPDGRTRYLVTDAATGRPLPGAKVERRDNDKGAVLQTFVTDSAGCFYLPRRGEEARSSSLLYVSARGDAYSPGFNAGGGYYIYNESKARTRETFIYTDRAIYRPGQTVRASAILFGRQGDEASTISGEACRFRLIDAGGREIARHDTVTDGYGVASASFVLPQDGLPGRYRVAVGGEASKQIRVEEYKRPTFTVTMDTIRQGYAAGDTLRVGGTARSYSGLPMSGARVRYRVRRTTGWWMRSGAGTLVLQDSAVCDENGRFAISMPLTPSETSRGAKMVGWQRFVADVDVLAADGETESAEVSVSLGREKLHLSTTLPYQVLATSLPQPTISLLNAGRVVVPAQGQVTITREGQVVARMAFTSGRAISLQALAGCPSGRYELTAVCPDDTLRSTFALFSLADRRPADDRTPLWVATDGGEFSADGTAHLQVGTPTRGATLMIDLFAGSRLVESRQMLLSDSVVTLPLHYQEAWGDGLLACISTIQGGRLYSQSVTFAKPLPKKRLVMRWTSFRDALQPGQHETWRLSVAHADGRPARASVLAVLYDASLDKFGSNAWPAALTFGRYLPSAWWRGMFGWSAYLSTYAATKDYPLHELALDGFGPYWPQGDRVYGLGGRVYGVGSIGRRRSGRVRSVMPMMANARLESTQMAVADAALPAGAMAKRADADAPQAPIDPAQLRSNFAETAFFMPGLVTGEQGELTLEFTLPQSVTAWNFRAVAHTQSMDMGSLDTTATARKQFMLTANLPRFVRAGDRATLAATLRNLGEQAARGTARLELIDAESGRVVARESQRFAVEPDGQQALRFALTAPQAEGLLIVRLLAQGRSFADGEQHYLPVVAATRRVTKSLPLTLTGTGPHVVTIADTLFADPAGTDKRLTVELTDSPAWTAIEALPQMARVDYENALTLAEAYYATALAAHLARTQPAVARAAQAWQREADADSLTANPMLRNEDVRQTLMDQTPWAADATRLTARRHALITLIDTTRAPRQTRNLMERLTRLQGKDGAWRWFSGMPGNFYVTLRVASWLQRVAQLTGADLSATLRPALDYLTADVVKQVARMKQDEQRGVDSPLISAEQLRYLDLTGRSHYRANAAGREATAYLTRKLTATTAGYDLGEKALAALILHRGGWSAQAREAVESIMQHSVATPVMGRYFDSYRAPSSTDSYRIPTQVAALEALSTVRPGARNEQAEMLTWLLQSKRTQAWSNPLCAVDAVYALLTCGWSSSATVPTPAQGASIALAQAGGKRLAPIDITTADATTAGYQTKTYAPGRTSSLQLTINKPTAQSSWGAVYATCLAREADVRRGGSELYVRCTYLRQESGRWMPLKEGERLSVGRRVRIRYDIEAHRDFDFVAITDHRPACFEPIEALSGYRRGTAGGYYRAVKDEHTALFFEHIAKGSHQVDEDVVTDRPGTYSSGLITVECCYAPEFAGRDTARSVEVK